MIDFFELEKKCKTLQTKKIIKYSTIILIPILLLITIIFYTQTKTSQPKQIIKKEHKKTTIKQTKPITKPQPKKPILQQKKQIIEHTLDIDIDLNKIKNITPNKPKKENKKTTIKQTKSITKPQSKKPILQQETISFAKAIKLAEIYYNNSDYKNSMKWCKLASKIDNNNEKVWKLYALNLEKTNQKEKAIKILKTYLKYKDSIELRYLLQRLTK